MDEGFAGRLALAGTAAVTGGLPTASQEQPIAARIARNFKSATVSM